MCPKEQTSLGRRTSTNSESGAWTNKTILRDALRGEALPPLMTRFWSVNMLGHSMSLQSPSPKSRLATTEFRLQSGPERCPGKPWLTTAIYLANTRSNVAHQIRIQFADAGCPILFDRYYHPSFNEAMRKTEFQAENHCSSNEVFRQQQHLSPEIALGMQVCELTFPDPCRPTQTLNVTLDEAPLGWGTIHPSAAKQADEDMQEPPEEFYM